jgi:gliding motility-associated-like protein
VLNQFVHLPGNSIAGCYAVAAVDSFMNESELIRVCVDNCPKYELPNTFSPNADGINDLFHPYPFAFIASVDIHIFNRWGTELFSTNDPEINWNGTDKNGLKMTDGVYFYAGEVVEIRLDGNVSRQIKGTIQLFGTSQKNGN